MRYPNRNGATPLLLNDLGVFDHGDPAPFGQLALYGDVFATVFGELIIDWLVFANHQKRFALAHDTDRPAILDAF